LVRVRVMTSGEGERENDWVSARASGAGEREGDWARSK
jgi:hypothetical protein